MTLFYCSPRLNDGLVLLKILLFAVGLAFILLMGWLTDQLLNPPTQPRRRRARKPLNLSGSNTTTTDHLRDRLATRRRPPEPMGGTLHRVTDHHHGPKATLGRNGEPVP